jgi:hypothetical protein
MYIFGVPPKIYIRILLIFPVFWVQYSRFSLLTVLPLSSICQYSRFFTQPGMPLTYPSPCQSSVKPGIDFNSPEPSTLHWNARGRDGNFFSHTSTPKMSKHLVGSGSSPKTKRARSESGHLHLNPYGLLFTPDYFFPMYLFAAVLYTAQGTMPVDASEVMNQVLCLYSRIIF